MRVKRFKSQDVLVRAGDVVMVGQISFSTGRMTPRKQTN